MSIIDNYKKKREEKRKIKIKERNDYEHRVINYNRVVAIELANRRKPKKAPEGCFISLKNINKIYDNLVQAVYDFNLDIKKNEFIVFVGPSGCGKSTTLRMIAGLEEITAGDLYIDGVYANSLAPKDRNIAMVFQSYALYPHMSVYENMAFSMKIKPSECPVLDENGNQVYAFDEKEIQKVNEKIAKLKEEKNKISEKYAGSAEILSKNKEIFEKLNSEISTLSADSIEYKNKIKEVELAKNKYYEAKVNEHTIKFELDRIESEIENLEKKKEDLDTTKFPQYETRKLTKEEIDKNVLEAAKILQIEEFLNRKPRALSGGQRQRVALGRAICKKAKLFLMDEPLSNLDAKLRVSMRSEIIRLHKAINATTIYVTHDQTEAMTMADRIVIMEKGVVQQIGTPREIYNSPKNVFVATFIGSPSMNILNVEVKDGKIAFDENNVLILKEEKVKALKEKIQERLDRIDSFIENGLEEEYEKELNVKRETLRLKFETKGYKFTHDEEGNIIDPIESVTLDEEEKAICKSLYKDKVSKLLVYKEKYLEMIKNEKYEVIFGIRPEDVYFEEAHTENYVVRSNPLNVKISIPELLGNEYYLHSELGKNDFVFKTSAHNDVKENSDVKIIFDLEKIHLFDVIDENILV